MAKKKSAADTQLKKAQKAQKQDAKKAKSIAKLAKKEKGRDALQQQAKKNKPRHPDESDEDIDAVLAQFHKELAEKAAVTEERCPPPSRRACGAFIANPIDLDELILFAGEYYDGQKVQLFADLFVYNTSKNEWRRIVSPTSPGPRSSHQLVSTNAGRAFLFGGEFVSSNQTTFFHYKDFWSLDLKTYSWERLEVGRKPSPRSGHRMVLWKHYIILFGGFYDAGNETRYLDDLHVFDTTECKWIAVDHIVEPKPTKRSGFGFIVSGDTLVLYGGYTKEVVKGKIARGIVHTDLWTMKLSFDTKEWKWEKRKRGGVKIQPRSGAPMVSFKGKGFMFGGVSDVKEDDETIESICVDDFFQLNVDQCRFYPVNLKVPPMAPNVKPSPRFNVMMCVQRSNLYIFGGILEKDDKEFTFADLQVVDLDKLTAFKTIIEDGLALSIWAGEDSEDDNDSEDDDSDGGSTDGSSSDTNSDGPQSGDEQPEIFPEPVIADQEFESRLDTEEFDESVPRVVVVEDPLFEANKPLGTDSNLREYFSRTSDYWMKKALDDENEGGQETSRPPVKSKEIRRYAFVLAEEAWEEAEPRLKLERLMLAENEVATKEAAKGRDSTKEEKRGRRV
ncbi:hypothetical protein HDU82_006377 [Entophlyctis luteolus]|nr:hypothetical protein HDU82_006377 [Entophlyctis luteolus]